jgi:hypothetical protein
MAQKPMRVHAMGKTKNGEASNGATSREVAPYSVLKVTAGLRISSAQVQESRPGTGLKLVKD